MEEEHDNFDERSALSSALKENSNLSFKPGEKYQYSNIGYWLLGMVIETVSGLSFPDYVRKDIFRPLNINEKEANFLMEHPKLLAKGY